MNEQLADLLEKLPAYLGGHMLLSVTALSVGLAVSLPLGLAASRRPRLTETTLAVAGVIQTVPSLALLALAVMLLGGMIGFVPAFLALTLYSLLPMLANTVEGINGVNPALTKAARGLGMNGRQVLFRVEVPLAAPVILRGIRLATVMVVGTATLATPVGGMSLGNYIFGGLQSLNHLATILGCVLAAALAVVLDQLIRVLEVAARRRSRPLAWAAGLGLLAVVAGGLYDPVARFLEGGERVMVGSTEFSEQHILNEVLARRLEGAGFRVDRRPGMSEGIMIQSLFHGQIGCAVSYAGDLWTLVMKRRDLPDREVILRKITDYLKEHDVECLGSLGFENTYAFALPEKRAEELNLRSVEDLVAYAKARGGRKLRIGGDTAFFTTRPEWPRVKEKYGLTEWDVETVTMDSTLMYGAVDKGASVDVIVAYSTDGRIQAYNLRTLVDTKQAFPPYDALLLVSRKADNHERVAAALRPLVGAVSPQAMRNANAVVDVDGRPARRAAEGLLGKLSAVGRKR
jgi:osmoprotectant transport system permease protein